MCSFSTLIKNDVQIEHCTMLIRTMITTQTSTEDKQLRHVRNNVFNIENSSNSMYSISKFTTFVNII